MQVQFDVAYQFNKWGSIPMWFLIEVLYPTTCVLYGAHSSKILKTARYYFDLDRADTFSKSAIW